jgi:hypothetical protein
VSDAIVIRGRYVNRTFVPDEALPAVEGSAELIVIPTKPPAAGAVGSIFDYVGKVPVPRSAEDIAAQIKDERDSWGEP